MNEGTAERTGARKKGEIRHLLNVTPTWWKERATDALLVGKAVMACRRKWAAGSAKLGDVRVGADTLHAAVVLAPGEDWPAAAVLVQRDELRREIEALR
jgi:hypothetical protein